MQPISPWRVFFARSVQHDDLVVEDSEFSFMSTVNWPDTCQSLLHIFSRLHTRPTVQIGTDRPRLRRAPRDTPLRSTPKFSPNGSFGVPRYDKHASLPRPALKETERREQSATGGHTSGYAARDAADRLTAIIRLDRIGRRAERHPVLRRRYLVVFEPANTPPDLDFPGTRGRPFAGSVAHRARPVSHCSGGNDARYFLKSSIKMRVLRPRFTARRRPFRISS